MECIRKIPILFLASEDYLNPGKGYQEGQGQIHVKHHD